MRLRLPVIHPEAFPADVQRVVVDQIRERHPVSLGSNLDQIVGWTNGVFYKPDAVYLSVEFKAGVFPAAHARDTRPAIKTVLTHPSVTAPKVPVLVALSLVFI